MIICVGRARFRALPCGAVRWALSQVHHAPRPDGSVALTDPSLRFTQVSCTKPKTWSCSGVCPSTRWSWTAPSLISASLLRYDLDRGLKRGLKPAGQLHVVLRRLHGHARIHARAHAHLTHARTHTFTLHTPQGASRQGQGARRSCPKTGSENGATYGDGIGEEGRRLQYQQLEPHTARGHVHGPSAFHHGRKRRFHFAIPR